MAISVSKSAARRNGQQIRPIMDIADTDRFELDEDFVAQFEGREPEWGPVGKVTYKRTYARPLDNGATEEWPQTLTRIVNGVYTVQKWHCRNHNLPWSDAKAQRSAQQMFRLMWDFKFLPGGRGLWMMGTPYVEKRGSAALNNCSFVSTADIADDFSEPFCFLMDFSMLGVGVGGDCKGAGSVTIQRPVHGEDTHVVADTREGWVDLVRRFLDAYVGLSTIPDKVDYSNVRPAGSPIKGFGGTASGPEPLKRLVNEVQRVLDDLIGKPITSEAIVDLFDLIGVCVVAGNVRRSAIIMFGDPADDAFLNLKNPETAKAEMMTHRWASNNSVTAKIGMNYDGTSRITQVSGEPGYIWLENARKFGRSGQHMNDSRAMGTNPCGEIILEPSELCNLVETFPARHDSYDDYERTLKYAYLYAKTVSLIPTHNAKTNAVMLRNRRIGVSQSGIVQSFKRHGRRTHFNWCHRGYAFLRRLDDIYSEWLCVRKSVRVTTVKPSGTVSLLPGATPGIHYEHSRFYFRLIRISKDSPLVEEHRRAGYKVEDDMYDQSGNTAVVYFPIEARFFDRAKHEVSIWEQLENAAQMQQFWSDNSVSVTVSFKENESRDLVRALELYESRLKTVSFLPLKHEYPQAPYIAISEEDYQKATRRLREADLSESSHEVTEKFCTSDRCELQIPLDQ